MTTGVTATGFVADVFTNIVTRLNGAFRAQFGQGIDVSATSVYGQVIQLIAAELADMWDGEAALYAAFDPDGATGVSLDNICALTGCVRNPATFSTVSIVLVGTNGTIVPATSVVSVGATGNRFALAANATIATLSAWASAHVCAVGALVTNDSGKIYYCSQAGTSAGSGGPTGTGANIVDNTAQWNYVAAGTAAVVGLFQATLSGPVIGAAGTLSYIATPAAGWSVARNPLDATVGTNIETDAALRVRRENELHQAGTGTVDAIRSHVLAIPGVFSCQVFDNPAPTTDGFGTPPYSFQTLVSGTGYDVPTLLATLWKNKPAGIQAYGVTTGTTPDSQGNLQTVGYTTPTEEDVYIVVNLIADSNVWNAGNVATLQADTQAALVAYGLEAYVNGKDVVAAGLEAQLVYSPVAVTGIFGVLDAACNIGLAPAPVTRTTISITSTQFAKLDSSRITVNVSYGSP